MDKIAVIGVGNIILHDDGLGIYSMKFIQSNYSFTKEISFIDGGVLGLNLIEYFQEFDKIFILDTISLDDKPGSIYTLPSHELLELGSYKQTAHEVEVTQLLELCSILETSAEVTIIGMVPQDISQAKINLCYKIKDLFPKYIDTILHHLQPHSNFTKNNKQISLDMIIDSYAKPSSQFKTL